MLPRVHELYWRVARRLCRHRRWHRHSFMRRRELFPAHCIFPSHKVVAPPLANDRRHSRLAAQQNTKITRRSSLSLDTLANNAITVMRDDAPGDVNTDQHCHLGGRGAHREQAHPAAAAVRWPALQARQQPEAMSAVQDHTAAPARVATSRWESWTSSAARKRPTQIPQRPTNATKLTQRCPSWRVKRSPTDQHAEAVSMIAQPWRRCPTTAGGFFALPPRLRRSHRRHARRPRRALRRPVQ